MSITPIVGAGISLLEQTLRYINFKESRKYSEKLVKLRNQLDAELRRPLKDQNDQRVEVLQDEIKNIFDIALAELRSLNELQKKES